jgi:hypothetical protein
MAHGARQGFLLAVMIRQRGALVGLRGRRLLVPRDRLPTPAHRKAGGWEPSLSTPNLTLDPGTSAMPEQTHGLDNRGSASCQ